MMEKLKLLFQHATLISFGILVGLSIEGICYHASESDIVLKWYHPITIILAGVFCSLPSLILWSDRELPRKEYILRIVCHFVMLFIVVMIMGHFFTWYTSFDGALFVAADFVGIYVFVWLASGWLGFLNQKQINAALDSIRDEE